MPGSSGDPGLDLVLDNRKLILVFTLLMLVCGGFFVFGFIEGKRQALRSAAPPAPVASAEPAPRPAAPAPPAGAEDRALREQLEWYRSMKPSGEGKPADAAPAAPPAAAAPPPPTAPAVPREAPRPEPGPKTGTYSVQVGAFREKKEAELKTAALAARGYTYVLEPPRSEGGFFFLKVGRFESRADAVALQLRLKKDGFSTFIKRN